MKKIALAAALSLATTSAFAGGMNPVTPEEVPMVDTTTQNSSSAGGLVVPLLLLLVVAAAVASN